MLVIFSDSDNFGVKEDVVTAQKSDSDGKQWLILTLAPVDKLCG
jgi:hypothetical protein